MKGRRLSRKLLIVLIYAAGVLVFAEGFSRVVLAWPPVFRRVARRDDVSWRLEGVRRHASGPAATFHFDAHHPTRGWTIRPGLRNLPVFSGKTLISNSAGMRGDRECSEAKPSD